MPDFLVTLFTNPVFVAPALSWVTAQVIKAILYAVLNRKFLPERLLGGGGMPSSHSATCCALVAVCGLRYGAGGFEFPMSLFFAFIVMYDAMGVRRETGEQAKILNQVLQSSSKSSHIEPLKELVGHSPLQVLVGGILGLIIGFVSAHVLL